MMPRLTRRLASESSQSDPRETHSDDAATDGWWLGREGIPRWLGLSGGGGARRRMATWAAATQASSAAPSQRRKEQLK